MASSFQLQLQAEQLQRTSEMAGHAFGHGADGEGEGAQSLPSAGAQPVAHWRWMAVLGIAGLVLLAMAALS
ncbi:MAG: hypothetical protein ACRCTD_16270 [Beijerinckiaceae bacterium]